MVSRAVTTLRYLSSENVSEIASKSNMEEDCQMTWSNRDASIDHRSPREPKRWRGAIECTGVTVEANTVKGRKRKASSEAGMSSERPRATSNNTGEATRVSVQDIRPPEKKKGTKRKASTKRQTSSKRLRATGEATRVSLDEVRPTKKKKVTKRKASTERQTSSKRLKATSDKTGDATRVSLDEVTQTEAENPKQWPQSYTQHLWSTSFPTNTSIDDFIDKYQQLEKLGEGGYGCVFAGYRKSDNLPVAIKHIPLEWVETQEIVLNEKKYKIPREVLVMQRVAGGPDSVGKSAAVSLIDWYNLNTELVLVIERPVPCEDLFTHMKEPMEEQQAKNIMKQLVNAVVEMNSKGVFHGDIKLDNILLETGSDVPRVRIIDFGISLLVGKIRFSNMHDGDRRIANNHEPTTFRELGVALLEMLVIEEDFEFDSLLFYFNNSLNRKLKNLKVSKDCKSFLKMCFNVDLEDHANLEQLQQHHWIYKI